MLLFQGGSGRAQGDGTKVTERAQTADFGRKPQIFADFTPSPRNSSIWRAGFSQKTEDKPQETADWAPLRWAKTRV